MNDPGAYAARQALELQFYGPRENQGPGSPYATLAARRSRDDISAIMVLADPHLCDRLIAAGIDGSLGAALTLVPVIAVAWCDGAIQPEERAAIVGGNKEYGFSQPECRQLLEYWLTHRPSPHMMGAWVGCVQALGRMMPPGDHDELRDSLINLCRGVASAAGGVFSKVSKYEEKTLAHISAAFDRG